MITFLSVTALLLQWQSWAAVTLTLWPIELKLFTNWVLYKMFQAEEKAQSVKSLSCMHNNLPLDPRTHIKRLYVWYISYPATEEAETGRWLGFPGQRVLLNSTSRERPCLSENKMESHQSLNSCSHTQSLLLRKCLSN